MFGLLTAYLRVRQGSIDQNFAQYIVLPNFMDEFCIRIQSLLELVFMTHHQEMLLEHIKH